MNLSVDNMQRFFCFLNRFMIIVNTCIFSINRSWLFLNSWWSGLKSEESKSRTCKLRRLLIWKVGSFCNVLLTIFLSKWLFIYLFTFLFTRQLTGDTQSYNVAELVYQIIVVIVCFYQKIWLDHGQPKKKLISFCLKHNSTKPLAIKFAVVLGHCEVQGRQ